MCCCVFSNCYCANVFGIYITQSSATTFQSWLRRLFSLLNQIWIVLFFYVKLHFTSILIEAQLLFAAGMFQPQHWRNYRLIHTNVYRPLPPTATPFFLLSYPPSSVPSSSKQCATSSIRFLILQCFSVLCSSVCLPSIIFSLMLFIPVGVLHFLCGMGLLSC